SILKTPTSAGSAADRQTQQPPPLPEVQPLTRQTEPQTGGRSSAERTRRVQFGDDGTKPAANVVSTTADSLLEQILAEPWFTMAEVPPAEKEPVTRGLLTLMKFTVSGWDHLAMCDRVRDIKRQLDLEPELHKSVEDQLISHMATIFEQSEEAGVLSEQRLKLMLIKGDQTVDLLEFLGYKDIARLKEVNV
uniref:EF-hand domain-containing protein n=1 Tax=Macrostomum lignano TaxID=282301 RepID=A0A1I8ISX7_9PLAT